MHIQNKVNFSIGEALIRNYYKLCIAVIDMAIKDSLGIKVIAGTSSVIQTEAKEFLNDSKTYNLYKDYIFLYRQTDFKDTYSFIDDG